MTSNDATTEGTTRRLSPRDSVARALYIYSGNQCAFNGCTQPLITESSGFVGRIAHIHAASDGGPRANGKLTTEERREKDNLMLLCASHAAEIDAVPDCFPVDLLRKMKRDHESRFSAGLKALDELIDCGDHEQVVLPQQYFGRTDPQEVAGDREDFTQFVAALQRVPQATRRFYFMAIRRTTAPQRHAGNHRGGEVDQETLRGFMRPPMSLNDLHGYVRLLEEVDLARWQEENDEYTGRIEFRAPGEGDLVADLREFLNTKGIQEPADIIQEFSTLNFNALSHGTRP